ncbi:MAG TPA: 30S ribosomal protein S16 [Candidatus Saccharimonadales bacterium]|nr:30S ribosomal protein S16 [Candidatus Saccharimonadales bacterium]
MLAIRMQRTGRKGHAMFRVVVQDSRRTPTSGKIVALLGSYDPHAKTISISKDKASFYLEHGAQPSDRVARLLKSEGVKLPNWVTLQAKKDGKIKNLEKLRRNRPAEEAPKVEAETPVAEPVTEAVTEASDEAPAASETRAETETPADEAPDKPETPEKSE